MQPQDPLVSQMKASLAKNGYVPPAQNSPTQGGSDWYAKLKASAPTPSSVPQEKPQDLGSRVAEDFQNRGNNIKNILNENTNNNPVGGVADVTDTLSKGLRMTGQAFGGVGDVAKETINSNPLTKGISDVGGNLYDKFASLFAVKPEQEAQANKIINDFSVAHPDAFKVLTNSLGALSGAGEIANNIIPFEAVPKTGIKPSEVPGVLKESVNELKDNVNDITGKVKKGIKSTVNPIKEFVKPSLTPEEQVGHIIQGKTSDIPVAQKTFSTLQSKMPNLPDINDISKMSTKDLSDTIQSKLIQKNLNEVDTHFKNDNNPHPISDFEHTVGKGESAVKTNYVRQAIDQLKDFYSKTNDAQGLSDIKALDEKANTKGLTSKELNDLAKEHGSTIKTFNANGEAASGLTKQAAENTRTGVKTTARNTLSQTDPEAATEVTRLDRETSDAIHTKELLDKQVEKETVGIQKKGKESGLSKAYNSKTGKVIRTIGKVGLGGELVKKGLGL